MDKKDLKYKQWMVTILSNKEGTLPLPDIATVKSHFDEECEQWVFQEETHENSTVDKTHYQCCIMLKIRKRKATVLKSLVDGLGHPLDRIRVDKMAGKWGQAVLYCSKADTKVGDTYSSDALVPVYNQDDIAFLKDPEKRYPWQNAILTKIFDNVPHTVKTPDDRTVYWITDINGCSGKSKLVKFACVSNSECVKLSFSTAGQLRSALTHLGPKKVYWIDIPRTVGDDDSLNDILTVVEDLKNGHITSAYYGAYNQLMMAPPSVVIFSNDRPPIKKLSTDRWKCYIIKNKELRYAIDNFDYQDEGFSMINEGVPYASETIV